MRGHTLQSCLQSQLPSLGAARQQMAPSRMGCHLFRITTPLSVGPYLVGRFLTAGSHLVWPFLTTGPRLVDCFCTAGCHSAGPSLKEGPHLAQSRPVHPGQWTQSSSPPVGHRRMQAMGCCSRKQGLLAAFHTKRWVLL